MKFKIVQIFILGLILTGCKIQFPVKIMPNMEIKKNQLTEQELQSWYFKDIKKDTVIGASIDRAHIELLKNKKGDTVIVALLDNRIDRWHEDIEKFIWKNENEIPNNKIDDDNNGYVDDIHGWNFLGNTKGENVDRATFEATRIVRKYKKKFQSKELADIPNSLKKEFVLYKKAEKIYEDFINLAKERIASLELLDKRKKEVYKYLSEIYNDSLLSDKNIAKLSSKDSVINLKITNYRYYLKYSDWIFKTRKELDKYLNIYLSLNYEERSVIGDDIDDIEDTHYGNGNINASKSSTHNHAIKVAGILGANRENNIGVKGISNALKIMPICVSPTGDEQDKDITLGIKYAVDNGAKIIIMTFTKPLVQHEDWLVDAFKYAANNDILVVLSAGNSSTNSDVEKTFPNDYFLDKKEYVTNVIVVGGITNSLNEKLVADFSNYGKKSVDIFAPSEKIYTTKRNNSYGYESGTSVSAPIVAGIATLIRSYYPNLTATEVKQIIMESGVSLDIMVNRPSTSEEKELVPFSSLSKSGKIVNAYNALLMAEEVSKKKKRKK
ncbi:cell wall-associated protease [Kordia sp. SMS9]|uniref:S8 family serine peptidase n=1 Tax=Kordia sp. SMS9 TaxID=2282170 RepID=UPI000E0D720E|nr:S8 family serine peptidase [Kordia sp. SMS9]AXG69090.1 cell wall-associated protease [Kordia sp. SMS9]